ncbi:SRPBCC family protein [Luteirhabdus pelagi]|uniref:SRPBCC family protein n=1 Tax=Luteirhabdus pelagi TaxID=2792783 RepID=UPI00193AAE79|nr:SRPBCC family protein [Luteirhabdus pelagi]
MIFLYILIGIIVLLIILSLVAPKKFDVNRSMIINRDKKTVFDYLKYIKNQDEWSPWMKRDPDMHREFDGEDGNVGFVSRWDSNHKQVGAGEQEIKLILPNERIENEIRFFKPFKSVNTGYFVLREVEPSKTEVTWGFHGKHKPPMNVMMLFMSMDKMVGKDFEEGLHDLKLVMENT